MNTKKELTLILMLSLLFGISSNLSSQTSPVAVNDTASVKKHYALWINVLQNDYDPDGHPLEVFYIENSGYGGAYITNHDSSIYYENNSTHGLDSLRYTIRRADQMYVYDTAWLFVDVIPNEYPAFSSEIPTQMVADTVTYNLYDYAADPDGDYFYMATMRYPTHGYAQRENDSTFSVAILENYSGIDSCEVMLKTSESKSGNSFYFKFNVEYNPEFPMAMNDTTVAYQGDTAVIPVLNNDFDPQNDDLKILTAEKFFFNQYFEFTDSTIIIVPRANVDTGFHLAFAYQNAEYEHPNHISNEAMGFLEILKNPNLPVAVNDTVSVVAGFPVDIPVLLNDTDMNGDSLIVLNAAVGDFLGIATSTDSVISFTPNSNLVGWHLFNYKIQEKHNAAHYAYGKVVVNIIENTNQPVAVNDTITIQALQTIQFNPLLNDIEPDGMPIKIEMSYFNNAFINTRSISDSIITITSKTNCEAYRNFSYSFFSADNPAMLSNEATITVHIIPDESLFYGITDTIRGLQGLNGTINLTQNDYNPGNDILKLKYVSGGKGLKLFKLNDSVVKYKIEFSAGSPIEGYYTFSDVYDTISAAGMIYLDIQNPSQLVDTLDVNNIRARFSAVGMNFHDPISDHALFEVPMGSGKQTLSQNCLWVGGKSAYTLHMAAETWRWNGADFWPGPVSETYQTDDLAKYKIWNISREEINYHLAHYRDSDYEPIESIATWPGNGNQELGQSQQLAPYFDQDGDGIYNALAGDAPQIRGDQSLYFIFNDDYEYHSESGGVPLKIEIHGNAYAFDQPTDSAMFNTIFVHYDIYNRSAYTYHDTYIGLFNDFDLGYKRDDYVGSDVSRGAAYTYNGNPTDGNGEPEAYGKNPPVQGMVILGGPLLPADQTDNTSGGCDESINGLHFGDGIIDNERMGMTGFGYYNYVIGSNCIADPQTASEYYSMLSSHWKDNSNYTYGGIGHISNPGSVGSECKFVFPGASDPLNWGTSCQYPNGGFNQNGLYWDEVSAGNYPGDRRSLSTTGPFTFAPGEVQSIDVAYVYARDNDTSDMISALDIMNQRIDTIRNRVVRGEIINLPSYSVGISEKENEAFEFAVFPNPSSDNKINIDLRKLIPEGEITYQIKDIMGRSIQFGKLSAGKINTLEIGNLRSGIYVIMVKQGNTSSVQKLMIR